MAKPIGELLKEAGVINDEHIKYALNVQKSIKRRLGDVLLSLGFVTDYEVANVLAEQVGLEFFDISSIYPDKEALLKIPYKFSLQNNILPVTIENGNLVVAIADPYNERVKTMIQRLYSGNVLYKVAPSSELAKKIERFYYLAEHPIDESMESIRNDIINGNDVSVENLINFIIEDAIDNNASDIHISPSNEASLISYRIDGVLHLFHAFPLSVHNRIISTVKVRSAMDIAMTSIPQDGAMEYEFLHEKYDFRVSTTPTLYGENLVIRMLGGHAKQITLSQIGFNKSQLDAVDKAVKSPFGIILATGPTGSGKTTTLYAMLRKINTMEKNVMTIEDPVEIKMPLIHQVAVNTKANLTFASAIRSFLRQDPDVMLIGEIRDDETATLAIRSALTGHLVLSTLHTNSSSGAVARLKDLGIDEFLLSSSLKAILAQRLVRKLCPFCKKEMEIEENIKKEFNLSSNSFYVHQGCEQCKFTGYTGRVAASEILIVDDTVSRMIGEGASSIEINQYAVENGMTTMLQSAVSLMQNGLTDIYEIRRVFGNI